ncbi:hypothetical protein ACHAXR_012791 [Thalassiosira sp. AJA248-18]
MGVHFGGGGVSNSAPADAVEKQSRIVSAASSVVSATSSLSSSSTKTSIIAAPPCQNFEEKKENEDEANASSAPAITLGGESSGSSISNPMVLQMGAPPHPVAEFLFQLTKMLTDNNSEYIEWKNASIFVHNPPGLEKDILPKYFRHSNYSSFQRQMNYFGFRKIAGKGKMAPCSYVNEAAKEDISSLLFIKRKKTGVSSAAAKLMAQQNRINRSMGANSLMGGMGGVGGATNSLMMGGALNAGALGGVPANSALSLNNFSMAGGMQMQAMAAGAANFNDQASLQQNMLAQLQQAHASALTANSVPGMASPGLPQAAQNKFNVGLGMGNGGANNGLLTNDQGNIYTNSNGQPDWSNPADAAAQSLFIQQGLGGNFPQGIAGQGASAGDANNFPRIDSAANLRALINQQISMFNTTGPPGDFSSNMNNALGATAMPPGMAQAPGPVSSQQGPGLTSLQPTGNESQGLSYEWNEMLQRMANGGGANLDNAAARQLEQHILQQGGNNGAPAPSAAPGQSFSLNGLFSQGGASGNAQGYSN